MTQLCYIGSRGIRSRVIRGPYWIVMRIVEDSSAYSESFKRVKCTNWENRRVRVTHQLPVPQTHWFAAFVWEYGIIHPFFKQAYKNSLFLQYLWQNPHTAVWMLLTENTTKRTGILQKRWHSSNSITKGGYMVALATWDKSSNWTDDLKSGLRSFLIRFLFTSKCISWYIVKTREASKGAIVVTFWW